MLLWNDLWIQICIYLLFLTPSNKSIKVLHPIWTVVDNYYLTHSSIESAYIMYDTIYTHSNHHCLDIHDYWN